MTSLIFRKYFKFHIYNHIKSIYVKKMLKYGICGIEFAIEYICPKCP